MGMLRPNLAPVLLLIFITSVVDAIYAHTHDVMMPLDADLGKYIPNSFKKFHNFLL
jgi:hypothetical protein